MIRNVARVVFLLVVLGSAQTVHAEATKPTKTDKCPVCGMFVAKYLDFLAQMVFKDQTHAFFDGAKDMFKYYFQIKKYNPKKEISDIDQIWVTDYYSLSPIDGRKAAYVIGSDVYGPMGRELIPFEKDKDAEAFLKDHAGKKIVRFQDVTPDIVQELDP
uniref:Nitrous oxide reductase accessory protein NosL n=1 Tax=Desulfatirhabdium butyrativorans TaxID=340467 RepID=A0A7C4MSV3_9BACT